MALLEDDDPQYEQVARRCDLGCETWPDEAVYSTCPICGEATERFSNGHPLSNAEAESILLHLQFEKFYEKWCALKGQPVDGNLPAKEPS